MEARGPSSRRLTVLHNQGANGGIVVPMRHYFAVVNIHSGAQGDK